MRIITKGNGFSSGRVTTRRPLYTNVRRGLAVLLRQPPARRAHLLLKIGKVVRFTGDN